MRAFVFDILALLLKGSLEINGSGVRAEGIGIIALILLAYWYLKS